MAGWSESWGPGHGVRVRWGAVSERACRPPGRFRGPPAQRLPGEAAGRAAAQQRAPGEEAPGQRPPGAPQHQVGAP